MNDENLREEAGKIVLGIFGPQEINRDDRWGRLQDAIEGLAQRVRDETRKERDKEWIEALKDIDWDPELPQVFERMGVPRG